MTQVVTLSATKSFDKNKKGSGFATEPFLVSGEP